MVLRIQKGLAEVPEKITAFTGGRLNSCIGSPWTPMPYRSHIITAVRTPCSLPTVLQPAFPLTICVHRIDVKRSWGCPPYSLPNPMPRSYSLPPSPLSARTE